MNFTKINIKHPTKEQRKKIVYLSIAFTALLSINFLVVYKLTSSIFQNELSKTKQELSDNNQNQISLALEQVELILTKIDQLETEGSTKSSSIETEIQSIQVLLSEHRGLITELFNKNERQDNTLKFASTERINQSNEMKQIRLAINEIYQRMETNNAQVTNKPPAQKTKTKQILKYTTIIRFDRWNGEYIIIVKQNHQLLKLRAGNTLHDEKDWIIKSVNKTRALLVSDDEKLTVSYPL